MLYHSKRVIMTVNKKDPLAKYICLQTILPLHATISEYVSLCFWL